MKKIKMIINIKALIVSFLLIMLIYSCGSKTSKNNENVDASAKTDIKSTKTQLKPKGVYVTSQNSDLEKYKVENLFDNSEKAWATMPGAGPDEGVMIYFPENILLGKMSIEFAKGDEFDDITKIGLYLNGQYVFDFKSDEDVFDGFDQSIESIYLRILETAKSKSDVVFDNEEETKIIRTFNSSKPVAIGEVNLWNSKNEKLRIIPPKTVMAKLEASSTLEPPQAYGIQNLFDSKYSIGWAEGNASNSGEGETINITFGEEVEIKKIKIWNGFQRSETHFEANAKVKSVRIEGKVYELKNEMLPQVVKLDKPFKGKELNIEVVDIFEGSKYKDLVISEMQFGSGENWFVPQSKTMEQFKSDLLKRKDLGTLSNVLDKWFYEEYSDNINDCTETKSIIIRSDYSFVIYTEGSDGYTDGFVRQRIYDGNWSIENLGEESSRIRIFGKRRIITLGQGAYQGLNETDKSLIFHDYLTITKNSISGERFFDEIAIKK